MNWMKSSPCYVLLVVCFSNKAFYSHNKEKNICAPLYDMVLRLPIGSTFLLQLFTLMRIRCVIEIWRCSQVHSILLDASVPLD